MMRKIVMKNCIEMTNIGKNRLQMIIRWVQQILMEQIRTILMMKIIIIIMIMIINSNKGNKQEILILKMQQVMKVVI